MRSIDAVLHLFTILKSHTKKKNKSHQLVKCCSNNIYIKLYLCICIYTYVNVVLQHRTYAVYTSFFLGIVDVKATAFCLHIFQIYSRSTTRTIYTIQKKKNFCLCAPMYLNLAKETHNISKVKYTNAIYGT